MWIFFEAAIRAADAREIGRAVCRRAGNPSEGISWEVFPNSVNVKTGFNGPLIKLPLGKHGKTGKRCLFLKNEGSMAPDQAAFLHDIRPVDRARAEELLSLAKGFNAGGVAGADQPDVLKEAGASRSNIDGGPAKGLREKGGPLTQKVIKKCRLIDHLLDKVEKTGYLTHQERISLLMVFGHLGEEGLQFLHIAMSGCINYSREITDRYIKRMLLPKPISCPRLREYYPELSASLGCDCSFHLVLGSYPSPVLHALSGKGVLKRENPVARDEEKIKTDTEVTYNQEADALLKKMVQIRKQIKQLQKSLEKHEKELGSLYNKENTSSMPVEMGTLVRLTREGGRTEWIVEVE